MDPASLRVLTWNIHGLHDDRAAVIRVLRAAEPDLVCLQEVPYRFRGRPRVAALAREAGLILVAGDRSSAGTALLCSARVEVLGAQALPLPVAPWPAARNDSGRRLPPCRIFRRGVVAASVRVTGGPALRIAVVHLGLIQRERLHHVGLILHERGPVALAAEGPPVVVAGDLNESPGGPTWLALHRLVRDPTPDAGATFSTRRLRRRIDAVLVGEGVAVEEYAAWQPDPADARAASDHLPVLAVLRPG